MKKGILLFLFLVISISAACAPANQQPSAATDAILGVSTAAQAEYKKITAEEAKQRIDAGGAVILDVRTQEEYDAGHIDGSLRLEYNDFDEKLEEVLPDKNMQILIYCRSGNRSRIATEYLVSKGYTDVYDFGGINDWPYETVVP